jgi:hypothetical protein
MPSISQEENLCLLSSASLHDPLSCINPLSDFLRWHCVLRKSVLPSNIRASPSKTKYYHFRCTSSSSHYHTDSNGHTGGSRSCKVISRLNILTLEPENIIRAFGGVSPYGPLAWACKQRSGLIYL